MTDNLRTRSIAAAMYEQRRKASENRQKTRDLERRVALLEAKVQQLIHAEPPRGAEELQERDSRCQLE